MWILGIIAASLATTLLIMLIKGGIALVGEVVILVGKAVIQAVGLVVTGVMVAAIWTLGALVKFGIYLYQKVTTKKTDVSDDANFDWMRDARMRDE